MLQKHTGRLREFRIKHNRAYTHSGYAPRGEQLLELLFIFYLHLIVNWVKENYRISRIARRNTLNHHCARQCGQPISWQLAVSVELATNIQSSANFIALLCDLSAPLRLHAHIRPKTHVDKDMSRLKGRLKKFRNNNCSEYTQLPKQLSKLLLEVEVMAMEFCIRSEVDMGAKHVKLRLYFVRLFAKGYTIGIASNNKY